MQHHLGHWTFPKGHAEPNETHNETAERELTEETGLTVSRYLSDICFTEEYHFLTHMGERVQKKVSYFPAEVKGDIQLQLIEVVSFQWVTLEKAINLMTFPEGKQLCAQIVQWMNSNL